jgi:undecaprenyl-diphosphatase
MDLWQTLILSVVEGTTEFLPISSTGHLILTFKALNIPQTEFTKTFEIFIQLGAIFAIILMYFQQILKNKKLVYIVLSSFFPTAIIGFLSYKFVKVYFLSNPYITLISLFIGGIFMIIFEIKNKQRKSLADSIDKITYHQAIVIGLIQSVSIIPGVSRAAATIIGGQLLGLNRKTSVEYSFLLAIPTIIAAAFYDLFKSAGSFSSSEINTLIIGSFGAIISAYISVKTFLIYLKKHDLKIFGVYRIILAVVFYLIFLK